MRPKWQKGGVRRAVPVRVLLVLMVLVPWLGMAYRTADRIDHDRNEVEFTDFLAPAANRVRVLARLERELNNEAGSAALGITARNLGFPIELAESLSGVPIRRNLRKSRREVDRAISALRFSGWLPKSLPSVRARFDDPAMRDPYDSGYTDLIGETKRELDAGMRKLWVMVAMLGGDEELKQHLQGLEYSIEASRFSMTEANLLLHRTSGTTFDEFGIMGIRDAHRAAVGPIRSLTNLESGEVADAARRLVNDQDHLTIEKEALRGVDRRKPNAYEASQATKALYPPLDRRNIALGKIADLAADAVSGRAKALIAYQRREINDTLLWLVASLFGTLTIALFAARSLSRPLRRLEQQARALVDGSNQLQPLVPTGPRELVVSAHALNELATTLKVVQEQADALAGGTANAASQSNLPPSRLGASVQLAVQRLSDSIQLNRKLRDDFEHAATHDTLTGLPNRSALYAALERRFQNEDPVGLLFVDLDKFKQVNDQHGHHVGDEVLQTMAARLLGVANLDDVTARLGGDEFVVLCAGDRAAPQALRALADSIRDVAADPIELGSLTLHIGASVGVAVAGPNDSASKLLRRADVALYEAKAGGRNRTSVANDSEPDRAR